MLQRGQKVMVSGLGGRQGELIVWQPKPHGAGLCTEGGYELLMKGIEAPVVGFPTRDIIRVVREQGDRQPSGA